MTVATSAANMANTARSETEFVAKALLFVSLYLCSSGPSSLYVRGKNGN